MGKQHKLNTIYVKDEIHNKLKYQRSYDLKKKIETKLSYYPKLHDDLCNLLSTLYNIKYNTI